MNPVLLTVNTISALVTIASAFLAIYRPGLMVHASSVDANARFYVYVYAVRAKNGVWYFSLHLAR